MTNNLDQIDHIAIQVKDVKKALKWYHNNFNCKEIYSDATWAFIEFCNIKLALVVEKEHPPHFAIINKKIILNKKTAKHRDGSVSKYIKDIDNNYIELIKYNDE